jgi:hypothetical protein
MFLKFIDLKRLNLLRLTPFIRPATRLPFSIIVLAVMLPILVSGCSKSTSQPQTEVLDELRSSPANPDSLAQTSESAVLPDALIGLQNAGALLAPIPAITSIEIMAESGLQVAYTQSDQNSIVQALRVELNWLHMQSCLQQVGVAPLVLIRSADFAALTSSDEVIHSIEGIPVASSTMGSIPVIQVGVSDFLMADDTNGYNLRSIMGRLLWSSAGLSVRDYPYSCARQLEESE